MITVRSFSFLAAAYLIVAIIFCSNPNSIDKRNPAEFIGIWIGVDSSALKSHNYFIDSLAFEATTYHEMEFIYSNDTSVLIRHSLAYANWYTTNDSIFMLNKSFQYNFYPGNILEFKKDTIRITYHKK